MSLILTTVCCEKIERTESSMKKITLRHSKTSSSREPKSNRINNSNDIRQDASMATMARSVTMLPAGNINSNQRTLAEEILKFGNHVKVAAEVYTFRELAHATDNFNAEMLLGEGGFGRVYKGFINSNKNEAVAVKQLDKNNGIQGNREFLAEVMTLSLVHHPNLVNLIGYCADGHQRILVYEYMENGSLEDHLLPTSRAGTAAGAGTGTGGGGVDGCCGKSAQILDWETRMKIAKGAAQGLEYLHDTANPPIIYRDFKTSNILLDNLFNPKLSDFGLAKLGPMGGGGGDQGSNVSTRVMGTYGYCAPEYERTGHLTTKSDVYSFGVVFLEIISGRRAIDTTKPAQEQNLVTWATPMLRDKTKLDLMADPQLNGQYPIKALHQGLAIAAMCLQEEPSTRPFISDVVNALEYLATPEDQADPDILIMETTDDAIPQD